MRIMGGFWQEMSEMTENGRKRPFFIISGQNTRVYTGVLTVLSVFVNFMLKNVSD